MNDTETAQVGCGWAIALLMVGMFLWTMVVVLAWNVGLYGAGIVSHKIGFWTALGLAFCLSIIRSIISTARGAKDSQ